MIARKQNIGTRGTAGKRVLVNCSLLVFDSSRTSQIFQYRASFDLQQPPNPSIKMSVSMIAAMEMEVL